MFEYYGNIHVYCPGLGAYVPLGPIVFVLFCVFFFFFFFFVFFFCFFFFCFFFFFSESLIFSPTAVSCKMVILNDFLKVFPIQMHWRPMLTLS